jgi:putative ABC transport system permease protein
MTSESKQGRGIVSHFFSGWTWRMAWRDSRTSRKKLALFACSIVLGIAALAAIGSLNFNLAQAIEEQAKALLGADLVLSSRDPFTPEAEQWLQGLGGEQSREISFSSMIFFPRTEGTRLVQVCALKGNFPYYGKMETEPPGAAAEFRRGGGALVEETLLLQFDAKVGDEIRVGKLTTRIIGRLEKVPGETVALSAIAPRVYISLDDVGRTGLLQEASLARHRAYFKFGPEVNVPNLVHRVLFPELVKFHLAPELVSQRKRELGRSLDHLYHFLNLVGFVALLLGGVGVASAIQVHIKEKLGTVAVLRCLGGSIAQTFAVYLAQGMALGLLGALLGGALGIAIQTTLPRVLADFIPFTFQFHTAWLAMGRAMAIGFVVCLLFTLLPLLKVRRVSPLAALRLSFEPARGRDPWLWLVGACLAAGILGFALMQTRDWRIGLGLALGLGVVVASLAAMAEMLILLTRRFVPATLPFTVRQGVANLHRPNNRTLLLLLSLGLGTFLMMTLALVEQNLLKQLVFSTGANRPNAVLFDIQTSQKAGVLELVRSLHVPILDEVPIVTMRISSVKGQSVEPILSITNRVNGQPGWATRHEYRSTYRGQLRDGERIVAGQWVGRVTNDAAAGLIRWGGTPGPGPYEHSSKHVPVSLEQGIAADLQVGLGDELVFDVQGVPIATRVASLREVEWRRIQPNFFVVFPDGVLEDAPAMHVLVMHVGSSQESARLQREVFKAFPSVSAIDLTLVLQTLDAILGKISFVIRFLAMFTVLTGLVVLVTALLSGRYQRIQESVLLRTLGASRRQVLKILLVEYFSLGLLAALTGIVLAVLAAWALAKFVFHTPFAPEPGALLVALLMVPGITVLTGFLMSRGVLHQSPLAILRAEG